MSFWTINLLPNIDKDAGGWVCSKLKLVWLVDDEKIKGIDEKSVDIKTSISSWSIDTPEISIIEILFVFIFFDKVLSYYNSQINN